MNKKRNTKSFSGSKDKVGVKQDHAGKSVSGVDETRTLVKTGFARQGDLIAMVHTPVLGKEGRTVLGEIIPVEKVSEPRLVAGKNVIIDKGTQYIMKTTGAVEVCKDQKGTHYISGKLYRHGEFRVYISDDEMNATLSVTPPMGGAKPVVLEDILRQCEEQGILYGLKKEIIEETTSKVCEDRMAVSDVIIAEGDLPVEGKDGEIEFKVVRASGSTVAIRDDGGVDYKSQDRVTNVKKDQLIAVVIKERPGERDGHTVRGEVLPANSGTTVDFEIGNNIRIEDKGSSIEYYSTINGQLLSTGAWISVEPVLTIEGDIGPKTGNISFNGVVYIKGSIKDNYQVLSKKDIVVEGNIGNCIVKADRNLIVRNGIVGKGKGFVDAGVDVTVKFAENSNIRAGANIYIQRAALNCTLTVGSRIISLKEKGAIIGGDIRAKEGIEVKVLGNESEHRMNVRVGSDFILEESMEELVRKRRKFEEALRKIALLLDKLKKVSQDPLGLPQNLKKLYAESMKKGTIAKVAIGELNKKQSQLLVNLEKVYDAEIKVRDRMHRGVKVHIGKMSFEIENAQTNVRLYYDKNLEKIAVEPRM
jgi:uncharacterized protein (DUF342 family)